MLAAARLPVAETIEREPQLKRIGIKIAGLVERTRSSADAGLFTPHAPLRYGAIRKPCYKRSLTCAAKLTLLCRVKRRSMRSGSGWQIGKKPRNSLYVFIRRCL